MITADDQAEKRRARLAEEAKRGPRKTPAPVDETPAETKPAKKSPAKKKPAKRKE